MQKYKFMEKLAKDAGCHIDTLYKNRRGDTTLSRKLSKKLADATGLNWLMFFLPEEYGNPWEELIK